MAGDRLADRERDLDRVRDQAVAFQLHLPARDIEARDQLLVGAGRGVGEHRLVELRLDRVELDVLDQQHRALPQRRHRLVRRIGLIDAQPHLARIGDQPGVQQHFVGRIVAELGALLFIGRDRCGIVHPGLDVVGGAHRGARAQERREARKAEPGFVPQEDQVRLDRQTFLHHPAGVVDVAVERAIRQVHHLDPIQPVVGLQIQAAPA